MLFVSPDGRVGHFLNIGDSGFHIFRPAADGTRAMQLFAKSEIQQHEFNYPYQVGVSRLRVRLRLRVGH